MNASVSQVMYAGLATAALARGTGTGLSAGEINPNKLVRTGIDAMLTSVRSLPRSEEAGIR